MRDNTWIAVILGVLSPIPGFLVAYIPFKIFDFFLGLIVSGHYSELWLQIMLPWFPNFFHGVLVGCAPFVLFSLITPRAEYRYVALAVLASWGGFLIFGLYMMIGKFYWHEFLGPAAFIFGFCGAVLLFEIKSVAKPS